MLGAIIGDMVGSPFEGAPKKAAADFSLFSDRSRFTDDSVMTVAVGKALMDSYGAPDAAVMASLVMNMQTLGNQYPDRGYGSRFSRWLKSADPKPYESFGNGSAMRVSAAGWLYRTLDETLHAAELTAAVTHNHPEGIKGAQAIAAAIFLVRAGVGNETLRTYLSRAFGYDLYRTLDQIRPSYRMGATCQESVPEAILCFLAGKGYVDVLRKAVSLGGDTDTIAAMAGSIAEARYGIPEQLEKDGMDRLTPSLRSQVVRFRSFYRSHSGPPEDGWQKTVYGDPDAELKKLSFLQQAVSDFYIKSGNGKTSPDGVLDAILDLVEQDAIVIVPTDRDPKFRGSGDEDRTVQLVCITDSEGNVLLPVFTSRQAVEAGHHPYLITDRLENCLETASDAAQVNGLIIDPYGQNFVVSKPVLKYLCAEINRKKQQP